MKRRISFLRLLAQYVQVLSSLLQVLVDRAFIRQVEGNRTIDLLKAERRK